MSSVSSVVESFGGVVESFRSRGRGLFAAALLALLATGCRQDMHDQPKYIPLRESAFFGDDASARTPVAGTVPRGGLRDDILLYTGRSGDEASTVFPFAVDDAVMARGQDRFNVFCSPCHGRSGLGDGMVVQRGYAHPPSFLEPRLRSAAPGHFFEIITNGFGAMPDYATQIRARDRWAIIAYIRALQLSGSATVADVPAAERARLDGAAR